MIRRVVAAALVLLCVADGRAWAQSCMVAATGLAFGPYQPLAGTTATTAASVTVTCNPGLISLLVSYTIQLGSGSSGSFTTRTLTAGSGRLSYQIYTDALHTRVWGDGTAGSTTVTDGFLLGLLFPVVRNYSAFGLIGAGQRVPIGSYLDTVTALITY